MPKTTDVIVRYDIPGMPKPNNLHMVDAGQRYVQHKKHGYDEYGRVIIVDDGTEDLAQSIGQYQDEVGPRNIVRMILNGADPNLLLHSDEGAVYMDATKFDAKSVNEFKDVLDNANKEAFDALSAFNKKYNTNLTMDQYLELYNNQTLEAHVNKMNEVKKEEVNE